MKSRCCTFYRNTSEPPPPGACTFRAQWLRRRRHWGSRREGPRGPPRRPRRGASSRRLRWTAHPQASAFAASTPFLLSVMLLGVLPVLLGRQDGETRPASQRHFLRPPPSPARCGGAGASVRRREAPGGRASSPPRSSTGARSEACVRLSSPTRTLPSVFSLGGVFGDYLKDKAEGGLNPEWGPQLAGGVPASQPAPGGGGLLPSPAGGAAQRAASPPPSPERSGRLWSARHPRPAPRGSGLGGGPFPASGLP